ncbi:hypothetical protein KI387_028887, partial [Taxus chinensis]
LQKIIDAPIRKVARASHLWKHRIERLHSPDPVVCIHYGKGHDSKCYWDLYREMRPKWIQKKGKAITEPTSSHPSTLLGQRAPVECPDIILRHVSTSRKWILAVSRGQPIIIIFDWTIEVGYVTSDVVRRLGMLTTPLPHTKTIGTEDGTLHGLATSVYIMSFIVGGQFNDIFTLNIIPLDMGEVALGNVYLTSWQGYMNDEMSGVDLRNSWIVDFWSGRVIHHVPGDSHESSNSCVPRDHPYPNA